MTTLNNLLNRSRVRGYHRKARRHTLQQRSGNAVLIPVLGLNERRNKQMGIFEELVDFGLALAPLKMNHFFQSQLLNTGFKLFCVVSARITVIDAANVM